VFCLLGQLTFITKEKVSGLSQLCAELGFGRLPSKLSAFRDFPSLNDSADAEARRRISALEEGDSQQEQRLAALEVKQSQVAQLPAEPIVAGPKPMVVHSSRSRMS
jgi:hypothetical protein